MEAKMIQDHTLRKFEMASNTVHDLMPGDAPDQEYP